MKINKLKSLIAGTALAAGVGFSATAQSSLAHTGDWKSYSKDATIEAKVDSLLALMTLEEKIGQMTQFPGKTAVTGPAIQDDYKEYMEKGLVGSMFNVFGAKGLRQLQQYAVENSRLNIPVLFAADIIHGYKTTFPIPLAESCSWDLELMERSARIAAEEGTAAGISWTFAPMIDTSRDPRWGRVMEGAGEDVYLGKKVAEARVKGFQGIESWEDFGKPNTMLATAKHFVAYGAAEAGRDYNTTDMSDRTLRETYFPPFEAAIDAGVATFMTSFNEIGGVPCTGSKYLYSDVLRGEWDFRGTVVTDYTAINEMVDHGFAEDLKEAAQKSLDAGIDMDMNGAAFIKHVGALIEEGKITEDHVNQAAARILELKFILGLFEDPYRYMDEEREAATIEKAEYFEEARRNAQRSIVLLKNENNTLPLAKKEKKKVALIGPFVKERMSLNGDWAIKGDRKKSVTLEEGLMAAYKKSKVDFLYAQGATLPRKIEAENAKTAEEIQSKVEEALAVAQDADEIIVAAGEFWKWTGEAASRTDITLPKSQKALLRALKELNKPITLVLMGGRPLDLSWEEENMDAILETWYLGTQAGHAIADVISGDYNPSGKITLTFPRNVGQIPIYYNHKNTGRPEDPAKWADYKSTYLDVPNTPLYPFGFGLSYASFEYKNLNLSSDEFSKGGNITASIEVTNTSKVDGEEIVQLYIRDIAGSVTRPVKELKGFEKVMIKAGETKTIEFSIDESTIEFLTFNNVVAPEAGKFNLWIGTNSADISNAASFRYVENANN
ncbi:beta-glucosidase BglX [Persicobacter sp. CCB-QB2]|uniref:beta-glucosidase BglX n=1 Tax=Persicobacter sp. CCB-QB2 TaxID=1561025 RepID=UPI000B08EFE5|nr:beta-glucosidase BglX [Persicobacter sp. CCB-QB2]